MRLSRILLVLPLLAAAACASEPEAEPAAEAEAPANPVERRVAPVRDMAAEADSLVRASEQRLNEAVEDAR